MVNIGNEQAHYGFALMRTTQCLSLVKGVNIMPKTKFQTVIFTLLMSFVMVYAMICYNIALNMGGMENSVFLSAFHEIVIMWPVAFVLELFVVDRLAHKLALKFTNPQKDNPKLFVIALSSMIVCLMCPSMSFVATLLFKKAGVQIVAVWLQTMVLNFPMAFFSQIFFIGPFVRWIFGLFFKNKNK